MAKPAVPASAKVANEIWPTNPVSTTTDSATIVAMADTMIPER